MKDIAITIEKNLAALCAKQQGIISDLFSKNFTEGEYTKVIVVNGYVGDGKIEISRESTKGKKQVSQIKVGRLIHEVYGIKFDIELTPDVVEKTSREFIGILENAEKDELQIVEGDDILKYYLDVNYLYPGKGNSGDSKGSLSKSCMRHANTADFLFIYAINPDKIKMLIRKSGDKLVARALLWYMDDGKVFMDRVYYTEESEINLFTLKAKKMGWYYYHGTSNERSIMLDSRKVEPNLFKVKLAMPNNNKYPYLDTVKFYYPFDDFWAASANHSGKFILKMETTTGSYSVQNSDFNHAITDEEFDRVKRFISKGDNGRSFDTSKMSFGKRIEYGKIFGNVWKFVTKNKWTNDPELLQFLKVEENAKSMSGTIILWDCHYGYIKDILRCIGKNVNIDYQIGGNMQLGSFSELIEDMLRDDTSTELLIFIVNILEQGMSMEGKNLVIMKDIYENVIKDDKYLFVLTHFKNSYLNMMIDAFDKDGILKKKLVLHIKNIIDNNKKVDSDAINMAMLLNGLVNTVKDSEKVEQEIKENYEKFIEKLYSKIK